MVAHLERQSRRTTALIAGMGAVGLIALLVAIRPRPPAPPDATGRAIAPTEITDNPPPTPPKKLESNTTPKIPPPPVSPPIEEVVAKYEPAVVWLGFELSGQPFMYATGWLLRPNVVVTTAEAVTDLETMLRSEERLEVIVWHGSRATAVRELRAHPSYVPDDPSRPESIHHNVGVAILDGSLTASCALASDDDVARLKRGSPMLTIGFSNGAGTKDRFDPTADKVRLERKHVEIESSDGSRDGSQITYRVTLDRVNRKRMAEAMESLQGAPVFDGQGGVVGVLSVMASSLRVASVKNVREWLTHQP